MALNTAVYWAYPAGVYLTFLLSSLCIALAGGYRKDKEPFWHYKKRYIFNRIIFWLQIAQCINLMICIAIGIAHRQQYGDAWWINKEALASIIAILLFYVAGLFPDPDNPFTPSLSHCHTWIVAAAIETVITAMFCSQLDQMTVVAAVERVQIALGVLRLATFTTMTALFLYSHYAMASTEEGEVEPLLGETAGKSLRDAQHEGWLDYVVGFSVLFPYLWPSKSFALQVRAIFCFFLLILQRVVNILVPVQLGVVVASLVPGGKIPYWEIMVYIFLRALQGQQGIIGAVRALLWIPVSQSIYRRLTSTAYEHVLSLSLEFHLNKRIGEVMSALGKGSALNTFLDGLVFQLFPMVADLWIAAAYFLVEFDAFYSLITISVTWLYLFVTIFMAKYRGRARREMVGREREMDAAKTDAIMSYETVHHNSAVSHELDRFNAHVDSFQKSEFSVFFSLNLLNATQSLLFTIGIALTCLLCAYQIAADMRQVAMFVTVLTYLAQLQAPLNFFGSFYTQVQNNLVDAERMLALFKEQPVVKDRDNAIDANFYAGQVKFSNVKFAYEGRRPALENVSFVVEPGTTTAIVGESGSGKSTILKLLFRFYDVADGSINVDGIDVRDMSLESLRRHIGIVPQDTILFNDTLMYNLLYARPEATLDEVYAACKAASIHDKIMSFPDGYETKVGERGLRLSGGEKQRIAIARTFIRSPRILLLDEATASLDSQTERQIQGALETVVQGRTTIIIAHRLSTITKADQILVLHEGRVAERGTHSELFAFGGLYSRMWDKQTKAMEKLEAQNAASAASGLLATE